jgi:hypothetical protein
MERFGREVGCSPQIGCHVLSRRRGMPGMYLIYYDTVPFLATPLTVWLHKGVEREGGSWQGQGGWGGGHAGRGRGGGEGDGSVSGMFGDRELAFVYLSSSSIRDGGGGDGGGEEGGAGPAYTALLDAWLPKVRIGGAVVYTP